MRSGFSVEVLNEKERIRRHRSRYKGKKTDDKEIWTTWPGLVYLRIGICSGCCENGNERTGFITCGELFDYLMTFQLLKKSSAA
jgi:hypothetical protein